MHIKAPARLDALSFKRCFYQECSGSRGFLTIGILRYVIKAYKSKNLHDILNRVYICIHTCVIYTNILYLCYSVGFRGTMCDLRC
jgi:hypothetical protein